MDTRRLRLLLFYNWIVTWTLLAGVNGGKPDCHNLKDRIMLTDDADICVPDARAAALGNAYAPVILDFSTAKREAFELLTKDFTDLLGAFVMDGNDQVETLNFDKIKLFDGRKLSAVLLGSNLISIRNNPNLKKLEWDASVTDLILNDVGHPLPVLIYNNPQLDVASFKMIYDAARRKSNIVRSFQDSAGECRFQNEHNDAEYFPPTADILKNCKKIKGDFKMTGGSLAGLSIQLTRDSCLQLINVDMTGAKLTLNAGKLSPTCKDKSTSKISNNKKLCGFDLEHLESSFNKPGEVTIELDKPSCTIACTAPEQKSHKYYICKKEEETTTTTTNSTTTDTSNNNNNNGSKNSGNASKSYQNSNGGPWVYIAYGVAGFFLLAGLIISVVACRRKIRCRCLCKRYKPLKDTVSDTFGEKMQKSGFQFIMDASLLDINTMRNKFAAVDKIVVDEKTREKPPAPWKSSEGTALGGLVTVDGHEYLIGSRPMDKETAIAFWEYAHDHLVRHFILIGEAGKDFMPTRKGQTIDLGTIKVTLEKKESPVKLFSSRSVRIKRTVNGRQCEWKVLVDHLASWTDDIPSNMQHCYDLFGLLERMNGQKTSEESSSGKAKDKEPGKPKDKEGRHMIVCPDGKERTGALLLLDMVWNELLKVEEEDENSINIEGLLARLRTQIPSAVSDFHLYLFLHLLIVKKFYQLSQPPDAPFPQKFVEEAFSELGLKDGRGNYSREKVTRTGSAENTGGTKSKETMESSP